MRSSMLGGDDRRSPIERAGRFTTTPKGRVKGRPNGRRSELGVESGAVTWLGLLMTLAELTVRDDVLSSLLWPLGRGVLQFRGTVGRAARRHRLSRWRPQEPCPTDADGRWHRTDGAAVAGRVGQDGARRCAGRRVCTLVVVGLGFLVLGWYDDRQHAPPGTRLVVSSAGLFGAVILLQPDLLLTEDRSRAATAVAAALDRSRSRSRSCASSACRTRSTWSTA